MVPEVKGNLWDYWNEGNWICITTNGFIKKNGQAVMGRGCAHQAAERFPDLPKNLGMLLKIGGNAVYRFPHIRIVSFPTKHNWFENSDVELIKTSFHQLVQILGCLKIWTKNKKDTKVYLPRPGCSNGGLDWATEVKPVIVELYAQYKERIDGKIILISKHNESP